MIRMQENLPRGSATDNQHATWLNINPDDGFAPPRWQGGIGDVIVAKPDKTPLSVEELGAIVDYVSNILDAFGDGDVPPTGRYNRARLDAFMKESLGNQADYARRLAAYEAGDKAAFDS